MQKTAMDGLFFHVLSSDWRINRLPVQMLRVMRLFTFFLFATCLSASATGIGQSVTISGRALTYKEVFTAIEKQTGYVVLYKPELVTGIKPFSLAVKDLQLRAFLDMIVKDQPLGYEIEDKTIFILQKQKPLSVKEMLGMPSMQTAPPIKITVTDITGKALSGATVTNKKTKHSGITDAEGVFSLSVSVGDIIEISFVGFESQTITVKDASLPLTIALTLSESKLDEVVVNKGYYTESRQLSTGSVGTIRAAAIARQPVSDIMATMYARIPGVEITQISGMAEGNFNIVIRGQNSLRNSPGNNGNLPLYVVDGVPFDLSKMNTDASRYAYPAGVQGVTGVSPLSSINPSDIASIEVLKDADATAIYGSRGANGVVVITTKKGNTDGMKAEVNFSKGSGKVTRMMDMLKTEDFIRLRKEKHLNDGTTPGAAEYDINGTWDQNKYTDWQKKLFGGSAEMINGQAAISGGTSQLNYRFSLGYNGETTVFPGDFSINRKHAGLALNHQSADKRFKADFNLSYTIGYTNLIMQDLTVDAVRMAPNHPDLTDAAGNLLWEPGVTNNLLLYTKWPYNADRKNLLASGNISYEILRNLVLKASFGINNGDRNEIFKQLASATLYPSNFDMNTSIFGRTTNDSWTVEPQLQYRFTFHKHRFDLLAGMSFDSRTFESLQQTAWGFTSEALMDNINAVPVTNTITKYTARDYRYSGGFGRINYIYNDKYVLNLTGRRDGSSRFGYGRQFANFAAVGAAWIFSKENMLESLIPALSFGKLRASYGSTGSDQAPDYAFLDQYGNSGDYDGVRSLIPIQLYNPVFAWEINRKLEFALETNWFNNRLQVNTAWFLNRSSNQLVGYPLPPSTGFSSVTSNMPAVVQNTGLEIELNAQVLKQRNLHWEFGFNMSIPRNKLVSYPGLAGSSYSSTYAVGYPLSIRKTYEYIGVNPQTGLYMITDVDKNNIYNSADRTQLMFTGRSFTGGVTNSLGWKQFQLEILMQFVKQKGQNYLSFMGYPTNPNANFPAEMLNRWQQPGDITDIQKLTNAGLSTYQLFIASNANVSDASFIRLKNISLSYSLPKNINSHLPFKQARVFVQGQNLLTITRYKGLDPETQGSSLPPLTMLVGGIQLQF